MSNESKPQQWAIPELTASLADCPYKGCERSDLRVIVEHTLDGQSAEVYISCGCGDGSDIHDTLEAAVADWNERHGERVA